MSTDRDCGAFGPKFFLVSFPRIPYPEAIKLRTRGFPARKNSCRSCHYEAKCRKALCLQAPGALWSNCKWRSQANRDFFLCKKYELLPYKAAPGFSETLSRIIKTRGLGSWQSLAKVLGPDCPKLKYILHKRPSVTTNDTASTPTTVINVDHSLQQFCQLMTEWTTLRRGRRNVWATRKLWTNVSYCAN